MHGDIGNKEQKCLEGAGRRWSAQGRMRKSRLGGSHVHGTSMGLQTRCMVTVWGLRQKVTAGSGTLSVRVDAGR